MKIEVRIVSSDGDENLPASQRPTLGVDTHERRGDAFIVQRTDNVPFDEKPTMFTIPEGGRLVLNAPSTHEELVYDREQGAAVRGSRQAMPHKADAPTLHPATPAGNSAPSGSRITPVSNTPDPSKTEKK